MPRWELLAALAAVFGCGSEPPIDEEWADAVDPAAIALVAADAWAPVLAEHDPLPDHRPSALSCEPDAWHEEIGGLEVSTGECNYVSLSQPAAVSVASGETLELALWWQPLISVEPAVGHIAILAGPSVLWEESVAIPGDADVREIDLVARTDIPAGTAITLHLHNHGANTWHFHHLLVHPHAKRPS